MNVVEIKIPVPWGHITGKRWGDLSDPIVLVLHGLLDNAGSFDRLIPLLPPSFCYIAIDLPGHGQSSHFPPFFPIHLTQFIIALKLTLEYFKREKYIILGHSYGGHIAFLFTQVYPKLVEKLILLDIMFIFRLSANKFSKDMRNKIEYCLALDENIKTKERPSYTWDEALDKLQNQRLPGLDVTKEAAEALLPRAVTRVEKGKYAFTFDSRVSSSVFNPIPDISYMLEVLQEFPKTVSVLTLLATESAINSKYRKPFIDLLKEKKNFYFTEVEGNHDVHNNTPENVATHIADFMLKKIGKL